MIPVLYVNNIIHFDNLFVFSGSSILFRAREEHCATTVSILPINTVCSKKSDAKIEIIITATNLIRIKFPLSSLNYHLSVQTLQISTKSTAQFLKNSCLKNGAQKQKFPIWKSRLTSSYAMPPVTVCAQSGYHLHRHLHVSCADRTFSAADGFPVCRPCSCVDLPQKSVQC